MDKQEYIAHTRDDEKKQLLAEHLIGTAGRAREYTEFMGDAMARPGQMLRDHALNVANLAVDSTEKCGFSNIAVPIGLLHDLGKQSPAWQVYLKDGGNGVPHSIFGAKRIYGDFSEFPLVGEMLANIIAAHHGKLYDGLSPAGEATVLEKLDSAGQLFEPSSLVGVDFPVLLEKLNSVCTSVPERHSPIFFLSMLTKFIFSCLVDADRLDAYLTENGLEYKTQNPDWTGMQSRLELHLSGFGNTTDMERMRHRISKACYASGTLIKGIYKLEVPTGGGKTLSSLRFALEHARRHNMDRIIYVIPYLSILSQTANAIRTSLKADEFTVLEHHSGFLVNPDDERNYKLHTDRWDATIILTTQVQFLESIFSAKGSDLRKLHNMANSVIIFDEAQNLPVKCVHLFNGAISFLHRVCGSTILLCTATQPLLDAVDRPIEFTKDESIAVCDSPPKRYNIEYALKQAGYTYPELANFVLHRHVTSTLVIVNTKAAAKSLVEELSNTGVHALHLSTNMCSSHRECVLKELFERLAAKEPVVCVSTQLIEAGVDISFECVIRDLAGLDSILQAAGRCNRHGEFGEIKNVYVINIKGENLSKLPEIKIGAEITQRLYDDGNDEDINLYYTYYFYARRNSMDYNLPERGTVYDLLSENEYGKDAYRTFAKRTTKPPEFLPALRSAADAFYVIDKGRTDIIVPYGESEELYEKYITIKEDDTAEKRRLLRELSAYGVSLYGWQVDELKKRQALNDQYGVTFLAPGFYDEVFGVNVKGSHEFLYL